MGRGPELKSDEKSKGIPIVIEIWYGVFYYFFGTRVHFIGASVRTGCVAVTRRRTRTRLDETWTMDERLALGKLIQNALCTRERWTRRLSMQGHNTRP